MVGDTVLFRLSESVQRPLLVIAERSDTVSGALFLDWEEDRATQWVIDHCFYVGSGSPKQHMTVFSVARGPGIGQWEPKPKPPVTIVPLPAAGAQKKEK